MAGGLSAYTKTPLMPAVWAFYKTLGRKGTFIQAAEIALRHFEDAAPKDQTAFTSFLNAQATKHRLAIGLRDFRDARKSAAKWYLVETYQIWDTFAKALNEEYRKFKSIKVENWRAKDGNETASSFHQLLLNLPKTHAQTIRTQPEFRLFEYYLAVRNWIIHPNAQTQREADRAFKQLTGDAEYFKARYSAVKAPNPTTALCFDDYMLFSRGMVVFAPVINDACDLRNHEIERGLLTERRAFLRNHVLKKNRIRNIASAHYTYHHGVNEARRNEFADYVVQRFCEGHYSK